MVEPLRPLSFGQLIDAAFRLVWGHAALLVGLAALPLAAFLPMQIPLAYALDLSSGAPPDPERLRPLLPLIAVTAAFGLLATSLLWPLTAAAQAHAAAAARTGRAPRFGASLALGWRNLLAAVWIFTLVALPLLAVAGLTVASAITTPGRARAWISLLLTALAVLAWLYAVLRMLLVMPVLMLEGRRGLDAVRRSAHLMRGQVLRAVAILFIITIAVGVVTGVLSVGLQATPLLGLLVGLAVQAAGGAVGAAALALLYVDIRVRSEGLDLVQLAAAAGAVEAPDAILPAG